MKKLSILVGTIVALVMTSCGGSLFGDDLISKEGIDKAKEFWRQRVQLGRTQN